jgi:hypothetical protein
MAAYRMALAFGQLQIAGASLDVWRGVSASEKMNLKGKARCQIGYPANPKKINIA